MTYNRQKLLKGPIIWLVLFLFIIYLVTPFISGLFNYPDRRGPLIYPAPYHEILHTIGRAIVGRGATKIPLAERPWFYGMTRKPIDVDKIQNRLKDAINQEEENETNKVGRAAIDSQTNR